MELSVYSHTLSKLRGECWGVTAAKNLHRILSPASGCSSPRGTRTAARAHNRRLRRYVAIKVNGIWTDTGAMQLDSGLVLPDLLPDEYGQNLRLRRRRADRGGQPRRLLGRADLLRGRPVAGRPARGHRQLGRRRQRRAQRQRRVGGHRQQRRRTSVAGRLVGPRRGVPRQQGARLHLPGRRPGRRPGERRPAAGRARHGPWRRRPLLGPGRARSSPTSRAARSGSATAPGCSTRRATCGPGTCTPAAPPADSGTLDEC